MLMPPFDTILGVQGYYYWIAGVLVAAITLGPRLMRTKPPESPGAQPITALDDADAAKLSRGEAK